MYVVGHCIVREMCRNPPCVWMPSLIRLVRFRIRYYKAGSGYADVR